MRPESRINRIRNHQIAGWMGLLMCLVLTPHLGAQVSKQLEAHPGYFDFEQFGVISNEHIEVQISVHELALRLLASAVKSSDAELADLVGGLKAIEVAVFDISDDTRQSYAERIEAISKGLEKKNWEQAMSLRSKDTKGYLYLRLKEDIPQGLVAAFISDEDQAIFVNIVGKIDPAQIGQLAARFNDLEVLGEAAGQDP